MIADVMSPTISVHAHVWVVPVLVIVLMLLFVSAAIVGPIWWAERSDESDRDD